MDDATPGIAALGPCQDCGRPLPAGTLRYCVHCGAEVTDEARNRREVRALDPWAPSAQPASTWSTGEFRAPSPLDGVREAVPLHRRPDVPVEPPEPVAPPPPPAPAVLDGWYADGASGVLPPAQQPLPPPVLPAAQPVEGVRPGPGPARLEPDDGGEPTVLVWPPVAAPPPDVPWSGAPPFRLHDEPAPPFEGAGPPVWPGAPVAPGAPGPVPPTWPAAALPVTAHASEPEEPGRLPVLPIVAAALVLVVVTTAGLLWLNSRNSDAVTATGASITAPAQASSGPGTPAVEETSGAAANLPPGSSPAPPTGRSDRDTLRALDDLLDSSAAARGDVAATAVALQSCRIPAAEAAVTFRRAGDERAGLAADATALSVAGSGDVVGLGDAVRAFITVQQASARADEAFADWADAVAAEGCRGQARHTVDWELANRYSGEASAAKARFVRRWNPIAAEHGLRARSAGAI